MATCARRRFDGTAVAVGEARRFMQETLHGRVGTDVEDDLALALSELASNAVLHAGTPFDVVVERDGLARIEVEDGSPELPKPRSETSESVGGRGMHIIERVCDRWGVHVVNDRKCVWCERDLS